MGPNRYTATASDPESEAWTTILSHPSVAQDPLVVCKLLQVSRRHAAAVHEQTAGRLAVQLSADTLARTQQFVAWVLRNSIILHDIEVVLSGADACFWRVPTAEAAVIDAVTAAIGAGLATLAGTTHPPPAAAAAAAAVTSLRGFTARGVFADSCSSLAASLQGVAAQLTHLKLGMLLRMQHDQGLGAPAQFTPDPPGATLAGMTALRSLVLHQPCNVDSNVAGATWPLLQDVLQDCVYNMKQLTRLELPVHMGDMAGLQHLQQCLPAGLQELQLGADAGSEQDEGAIAFGVIEGEEVLQGRQQYPLELSHLTALTKLTLSASVPLVSDDELPATLLQLRLRQCFDLHPLLGLTKLQSLALRPSTIPPRRLQDLTQLTSLTSVKLFYEGGYKQCGEFTHWSIQRLNESAAVWIQLPVVSLGLYEGSGPYEGGLFGPLTVGLTKQMQKLAGLTSLTLDWPLEHAVFAGIVQLTHLRQLSLHWGWYDEYVGTRWTEHTAEHLANCADAVLHVMHGFAALPHLQELCWLCDEDRDLCLSLEGLQQSLEQLGPRGAPGSMQVSIHELAALVEPNMEEYEY